MNKCIAFIKSIETQKSDFHNLLRNIDHNNRDDILDHLKIRIIDKILNYFSHYVFSSILFKMHIFTIRNDISKKYYIHYNNLHNSLEKKNKEIKAEIEKLIKIYGRNDIVVPRYDIEKIVNSLLNKNKSNNLMLDDLCHNFTLLNTSSDDSSSTGNHVSKQKKKNIFLQ